MRAPGAIFFTLVTADVVLQGGTTATTAGGPAAASTVAPSPGAATQTQGGRAV